MALTAREWILLSEAEQKQRKDELSSYECFLLRTNLAYAYLTEDEKSALTEQQKYEFTHPKEYSEEEKLAFNKKAESIFTRLIEESSKTK